jgi:hypothetical protein
MAAAGFNSSSAPAPVISEIRPVPLPEEPLLEELEPPDELLEEELLELVPPPDELELELELLDDPLLEDPPPDDPPPPPPPHAVRPAPRLHTKPSAINHR